MASLSKEIELYLKRLLAEQEAGMLEIQRSLLSELFECVPSQINYVLSTRFTPQNGYIVETRRGGGGYVRIVHMPLETDSDLQILMDAVGEEIGERDEELILDRLADQGIIPTDVTRLFKSLLKDRIMKLPYEMSAAQLRAHLMTHLLANLSIQQIEDSE